ncbi:hypothetical protein [Neobacillus kokaensis]|uniref:Uncharacterized protein n=1 Tax=Neobacillus kokaensis TaxID=2759023 RepID=A0ABQ3N640_9BACI|nr:hypothetical protein [Neobacillus kokaensis]GHI00404.1 hypothetical protein AM1BK_39460 [Neobacillus kokaensis]
MKNKIVLYQGKKYKVLYHYSSDYCEIQEENFRFNIQLVHKSELTMFEEKV